MANGYLLDTSVVSVFAPGREVFVPTPLQDWLREHHKQLYLPCIAIAEMAQGIGKLRRAGGVDRADRLDLWLDGLLDTMQTVSCRWTHKLPGWSVKFRMQPLLKVAIQALQTLQLQRCLKTQGCYY